MRFDGQVRAKKHLGQHFLKDESIAERIAAVVPFEGVEESVGGRPGNGCDDQIFIEKPVH